MLALPGQGLPRPGGLSAPAAGAEKRTDQDCPHCGGGVGVRFVAARAVVPVLLDSGRLNSGKDLQEIFFELDALDQEMTGLVSENAGIALELALKALRNER